jgi:hypothetical protein
MRAARRLLSNEMIGRPHAIVRSSDLT